MDKNLKEKIEKELNIKLKKRTFKKAISISLNELYLCNLVHGNDITYREFYKTVVNVCGILNKY